MADKNKQLKELARDYHELENYFRNTIIPQLYVDGALKLQKFTPPAMKQFTLSARDVGKPINDIKENFRFPKIVESIEQVIKSNEILEKEIQTTDLRWYQMNIIPYVRMEDNQTDGVIITFVEITSRTTDLKELEKVKVGDIGVTIGRLAPMGKIKVNNEVVEVRSTGTFVDPGQQVRIIQIEKSLITVEPLNLV